MIAVSVNMASRTGVQKRNFLLIKEHRTLPPSMHRVSELKCDSAVQFSSVQAICMIVFYVCISTRVQTKH